MFRSLFRAAADDRSPWGDFWFEPVSVRTLSGARVSSESALRLSAVYRAVALVSGHIGMLPVRFFRAGTLERVDHPLLRLLNRRPNRWQNGFEWREMLEGHLELRGNAYNRILDNGIGEITELVPIHPDRIQVEVMDSGDYRYRITSRLGAVEILSRGDIWHLRGMSSDGITGMSTVEYARESIGLGLAAQDYGARFFANDAKPSGGWIELPGKFADKAARTTFVESWQQAQGGRNRGKTAVLEGGMKFHEVGLTNEDAQFLETRKFQISDIARWFGIPPHKLADLEKSSFSNIEQQALEYIQDALQPRATRWETSISSELLLDDDEIDVRFDFRELMRGDSVQRSTYYHNGILDGWLTRNQAREMEGFEPLDGLDEPLRPLNMVEESNAENVAPPEPMPQTPPAGSSDSRLTAVLGGIAGRLARKEAAAVAKIRAKNGSFQEFYYGHATVIAESMAIDLASARAYCDAQIDALGAASAISEDDHRRMAEASLLRLTASPSISSGSWPSVMVMPAPVANVNVAPSEVHLSLPRPRRRQIEVAERDANGFIKRTIETEIEE